MRRIGVLALLLWAVSTIGTQTGAAEARRKAVAGARTGSRQSTPTINSKTAAKAGAKTPVRADSSRPVKQAGRAVKPSSRSSRLHTAARATVRKARYTPQRRPAPAVDTDTDAGYAAGFKNGYQAGLAAARKQLERDDAAGTPTFRSMTPAANSGSSFEMRVPDSVRQPAVNETARRPETKKATRQPVLNETTETEVQETPPIDQIATLHLNGAGMPAPLRGSLASLERQNDRTEADGLERILDEADLANRIKHRLLVPVPASSALMVNPSLSQNHRYCRPWTARFLADLARAHSAAFHRPIQVNSAVRTVEYQKRLMNTNGNAAAAEGDVVSPHLTGATIDIAKQGLNGKEIGWMRQHLLALQKAGKIDVEEEFAQACFHITVYKSYTDSLPQRRNTQPEPSRATAPQRKAGRPALEKPASQLPADLAVGVLGSQGR